VANLELCGLSVARASKAIQTRDVSRVDVTEAYLRRIEEPNPCINAYITAAAERAPTQLGGFGLDFRDFVRVVERK
jgi:Asp-tRNA(Asn)/Glu-tRNA(Gln) amidotransferase A subunit family amidase